MNLKDWIFGRDKLDVALAADTAAKGVPPITQMVQEIQSFWEEHDNKYQLYEAMSNDPFIAGALSARAAQVVQCFRGLQLDTKEELKPKDEELLKIAQEIYEDLAMELHIKSAAHNLGRDGDVIYQRSAEGGLRQFPIRYMTITQTEEQIGKVGAQNPDEESEEMRSAVFDPNFYVYCEGTPVEKVFPREAVLHISINNKGQEVYDRLKRYTHGIWSKSPIRPLKDFFTAKQNIMIADGLWRQRNVPREVHTLELSTIYNPDMMRGASYEARVTAAESLASTAIKKYRDAISTKKVDQGFVVSDAVKIEVLEPKTRTYADPTPIYDYADKCVSATLGVTRAALVGDTGGSFAQELVLSSYAAMRAEEMAKIIAKGFIEIIRAQVNNRTKTIFEEEELRRLTFRLELIMSQDRDLISRIVSTLAATGVFDPNELRDVAGYPPMTKKQLKRWKEIQKQINELQQAGMPKPAAPGAAGAAGAKPAGKPGAAKPSGGREAGAKQTPKDSASAAKKKTGPGKPSTPQSKKQRQVT